MRTLKTAWSQKLAAGPRGLSLAREKGWLLAWDQTQWLYLFNQAGARQGQVKMPASFAAAASADDGSAHAAIGSHGEVWWLAPDLMTRWERTLPHPNLALALDPFGQYLGVADQRGIIHFFNKRGQNVGQVQSPRPLLHLTFVPAAPVLVGCADYGLVGCFDMAGTWRWRDGLVVHTGALVVTGDGAQIAIACFSDGIQRYDLAGQNLGRKAAPESCRLLALSFDGKVLVMAGLSNRLVFMDQTSTPLAETNLEKPACALAVSALGDRAYAALQDGPIVCLAMTKDE